MRFLTGPAEQQSVAKLFFEEADKGFKILLIPDLIVAESVYVLHSQLGFSRAEIASVLIPLLQHKNVEANSETLVLALRIFVESKVDFADCFLTAISRNQQIPIASFDRDFAKLKPFEWLALTK